MNNMQPTIRQQAVKVHQLTEIVTTLTAAAKIRPTPAELARLRKATDALEKELVRWFRMTGR